MKTIATISSLRKNEENEGNKPISVDVIFQHGKKVITGAINFCDSIVLIEGDESFLLFLHHDNVPGNSGYIRCSEIKDLREEPEYDGMVFKKAPLTDEEKKAKRKERREARKAAKKAKEAKEEGSSTPSEPEGFKLTKLEQDVILNGFGNNEYNDEGDSVWRWSIQPNCKEVTEKQISGVISSLVKKGLAVADQAGKDSVVSLTDDGKFCLAKLRRE